MQLFHRYSALKVIFWVRPSLTTVSEYPPLAQLYFLFLCFIFFITPISLCNILFVYFFFLRQSLVLLPRLEYCGVISAH